MRDIFELIISVIVIALWIVAAVAGTRAIILDKVVIVHSGAIVITEVSATDHDSESMCRYTLSQKDENDKLIKKFALVTRCCMCQTGLATPRRCGRQSRRRRQVPGSLSQKSDLAPIRW